MNHTPATTRIEQPDGDRLGGWRDRAECRESDPDWFFDRPTLAVPVCRRCPVWLECRTWAVSTGQQYGVWGGLTEAQLRAAQRRGAPRPRPQAPPRHGTPAGYKQHRRRNETACPPCLQAEATSKAARKAAAS